ncbi:MAG: protein kinase [Ktedonobacteraceae bacterium]
MEIGRVIDRHYLVQRLVKQGQVSTVYQGFDQKLQRVIALKAVPISYAQSYRGAAHITAQFSHPNIVTLYDLIPTPETLYLVQEYIDGQDFVTLAQMQLAPYEVVDIGRQICLALLYAGADTRRICHGDLTPAAILLDQYGIVRVNNFALPGDLRYFTAWSILGGDGVPLLKSGHPPDDSEERRADDTRAVGLLLYQLLTRRLEPPSDGQLRFPSSVPSAVCDVVARAILRQHPQHIRDAATLHDDLNALVELLEPPAAIEPAYSGALAYQQAPVPAQISPAGAIASNPLVLPGSQPQSGRGLSTYASAAPNPRFEAEPNAALTVADSALMVAPAPTYAQSSAYSEVETPSSSSGSSLWLLLILGLVIFALFFIAGYFLGIIFIH